MKERVRCWRALAVVSRSGSMASNWPPKSKWCVCLAVHDHINQPIFQHHICNAWRAFFVYSLLFLIKTPLPCPFAYVWKCKNVVRLPFAHRIPPSCIPLLQATPVLPSNLLRFGSAPLPALFYLELSSYMTLRWRDITALFTIHANKLSPIAPFHEWSQLT